MELINITTSMVSEIMKPRPIDMHKGQAGRVLIIAGSKGMAGAAVLATRGSLYSGAGLVKVAVPEELFNIIQISVPEAMCVNRNNLTSEALQEFDVIAIGPGLGVHEDNEKIFDMIFESYSGPLVIDADGINSLCKYKKKYGSEDFAPEIAKLRERSGTTVLTPHIGEANRIIAALENASENEPDKPSERMSRQDMAKFIAKATNSITLLKGHETIITSKHSKNGDIVFVNTTGNPGMATGGSGDVLTGITASLLAQKHLDAPSLERVASAAFIHGIAGDIAAENIGEYGMTASDIADAISMAIKEIAG